MSSVETYLLSPSNFKQFPSNISSFEAKAFKELRIMKQNGISVFLQDKSSRFVIAKQDPIAEKVDLDISDSRYSRLEEDDVPAILCQIKEWYTKYKSRLSGVDTDISGWLINEDSKPGKLKVLLKTHKPGMPVREVFSVCSQPIENLSSLIQFCYLGPIANSGKLKWRLKDTTHLIRFLHTVNDFILERRISDRLNICSVDIKNMFPSIYKDLAFPAIKKHLKSRGHSNWEIEAVIEALRIVRDGTRVGWKGSVIKQLDGCSLGPADSCDYCDIALNDLLEVLVPKVASTLGLDMKFLRFFRDDGLFFFFGDSSLILDMLDIFNSEREELVFTTEYCPCKEVLGCCRVCPQTLPYLDCLISVYYKELDDGTIIPQLKTTTYSKPTDIHHYIEPSSCTPGHSKKSPAIIKGVAHRLRITNMLDEDFLISLNTFSGYLVASGYDKVTVLKLFTDMLSKSNRSLVFHEKVVDNSFKIAFVTKMHPALPKVERIFDQFYPLIASCSFSSKLLPRKALISTNRKLPNLSSLLTGNPFQRQLPPSLPKGFQRTMGCSCKVCSEGFFASVVFSPSYPDRGFSITKSLNCRSRNVIYQITCHCGKNYVGRTKNPNHRWANHKSHIRLEERGCNMANHCIDMHSNTMVGKKRLMKADEVKSLLQFTLIDSVGEDCPASDLKKLEDGWRDKLSSWVPQGMNTKDD